ncbi:MAG: hypothetical protein MRY83_01335 [Flavobacteriales bacterium]|nr:hypothetical protein [Flavobacteriales bacterium]
MKEEFVQNFYKNSTVVESEGNLLNGKKHGLWKFYYENGQLKSKGDYLEDQANGHFYYYHENGQESANGIYEGENRIGDWIWHFDNAQVNQYGSYVNGKLEGDYRWFHKTGEPSTVGQFKNGKRFGDWVWTTTEGIVTTRLTYNENGHLDGLEQRFSKDGKILLTERNRVNAKLHGKVEKNDEQGNPIELSFYVENHLDGEQLLWEDGKKTIKNYVLGVPVFTDKKWKSLASKINKKKDHYAKMDVLDDVVEYNSKERAIWHMFVHNFLDFDRHYDLWSEIEGDLATIKSSDLVELLKTTKLSDKILESTHNFLAFWPFSLDQICMHLYAQDPEPFDEAIEEFDTNVKEGVKSIQIRFGKLDKSKMGKNMSYELAYQHIHDYGLGTSVGGANGYFNNVWWQKNGKVFELSICENNISRRPNQDFDLFINTFTDLEHFKETLLEVALKNEHNLPVPQSMYALQKADKDQFVTLFKAMSTSTYEDFYWVLTELRNDSIEDLEYVAKEIKDDWRIGQKAECTIITAMLKRKSENLNIPEWYDEYITFESFYSGKSQKGNYFAGIDKVEEALEYLPKERLWKIFQAHIQKDYGKDKCLAILGLLDRNQWDQVLDAALLDLKKDHTLYNRVNYYAGLSRLKESGLEWIFTRIQNSKEKHVTETLEIALIYSLSSLAGENIRWDEKYNTCFQIHNWPPKYGDDYDHYVQPFFSKAFNALSEKTQTEVLMPQIDGSKKTFIRVFSLFDENTPDKLIEKAIIEVSKNKIKAPGTNWISNSLSYDGKLKMKAKQIVEKALENNVQGEALTWFKNAVGDEEFQKIKEKLEKTGKQVAKEKTKFELLKEACEDYFNQNKKAARTKVYWLERGKSNQKSLNRIGGMPIGLDEQATPKMDDDFMQHLLTIDLKDVPEIAKSYDKDVRAVSLYLAEPSYNEAYQPYNKWSKIVPIKEADIESKKFSAPEFKAHAEESGLEIFEIEVPSVIFFSSDDYDIGAELEDELQEIRDRLYRAPGYVSGNAMWLQAPEHGGNFLMQFDEQLVDVNLGDTGIMYVFSDTAFWQCH